MLELSHIILSNSYMYRQSLMAQQTRMEDEQFISKLGNLPMVNLAWTTAFSAYEKTKERHTLLKTALNLAESSVTTVAQTAKPLVDKVQPQIAVVNHYACEKLNNLETKYPVITQPADEVYASSKKACEEYLKPVTSTVSGVYNVGKQQVTRVGQFGTDTVNGVKNYSTAQIARVQSLGQGVLDASLGTKCGQLAVSGLDGVLSTSEHLVDRYLPPEDGEIDKPEKNPLYRATSLTSKVRRRMYKRAMRDLRGVQVKGQDALSKLNFTVNLIDYAKNNIEQARTLVGDGVTAVQEKVGETWTRITSEEEEGEEKNPQNLEERTILLARRLTRQIRNSTNTVSQYVTSQPQHLRESIAQAKKYVEELYTTFSKAKSFEDLPSWFLNETKDRLSYVQEALSFATDLLISTPLNWLSLDLDLHDFHLEDPEFISSNGLPHVPALGPDSARLE
ncbi:perilipin-2-like isoform X1 [Haliotis cracherodii]|uniref:perilipin-2-like isoform X1 n=1 Tax=Haliotis cracherodii TaxID=6455 RepID=UPI0039EAC307